MIVQSFRSVLWVGAVATAALGCYMVSLSVAAERASLERVEGRILLAKREIRSLETELGTRGRLTQLERWNVEVLALSAPGEGQFVQGAVQLASLVRPQPEPDLDAPLRMAALEGAPERRQVRTVMAKAERAEAAMVRTAEIEAAAPPAPRLIRASVEAPAVGLRRIREEVAVAAAKEKVAD